MTFDKLILSGIKIGAMAAMRGSFWFTLIAIPVLGGDILFAVNDLPLTFLMFFFGFIFGVFSCLLYSLLPGIVGGIVLAFWLDKRKINSSKELWTLGSLVGGLAGMVDSMVIIFLIGRGGFDEAPFPYNKVGLSIGACLAILTACVAGIWGATRLYQMIMNPDATSK